jgi:hypothetical protein
MGGASGKRGGMCVNIPPGGGCVLIPPWPLRRSLRRGPGGLLKTGHLRGHRRRRISTPHTHTRARWPRVDISRPLRNAKTRPGQLHFRDIPQQDSKSISSNEATVHLTPGCRAQAPPPAPRPPPPLPELPQARRTGGARGRVATRTARYAHALAAICSDVMAFPLDL